MIVPTRRPWTRAVVAATLLATSPALAAPGAHFDPTKADGDVTDARTGGVDGFCKSPRWPLSPHAYEFCDEAQSIPNCEGLVKACGVEEPKNQREAPSWLDSLVRALGPIARVVVYLAIAAAVGLVLALAIAAILRARRDRAAADDEVPSPPPPTEQPVADAGVSTHDAEALLKWAETHATKGDLDRAALLYLAAALSALDRRGVIRLGRDRTHGEYVRGCAEPRAKEELRALVRAVDRVEYGGERPSHDQLVDVARRATLLVRAGAVLALGAMLLLCGCERGAAPNGSDPAGDEILLALLGKQGAEVKHLTTSIATLAMPKEGELVPVVLVDADRVPLEDESSAHLEAWVRAGGLLVLAGSPSSWPQGLKVKSRWSDDPVVSLAIPLGQNDDDDGDGDEGAADFATYRVHLARGAGFEWKGAYTLGATQQDVVWAARSVVGKGMVLALASDDLLTNAGLSRSPNAAALMALLAPWQARTFRVARVEDGIAPPSNPMTALVRAGLGLPLAHAAGAALLLMLAYGIRLARPRPTSPPGRRRWTEHLEATGGLYARARLAAHALAAYTRFVDGRLRARMPRGMTDPAAFLASRTDVSPGECAAVWARATAARSDETPRGDELATLRALSALYAAATKAE